MMDVSTFTRRSVLVSTALALASPALAFDQPSATVKAVPGTPQLSLGDFSLAALGYEAHEFFLSGSASAYDFPGVLARDGEWSARAVRPQAFVTRLVVVRPNDPKRFNGTVVVEWLNVSNGGDNAADWTAVHREIVRSGAAYVGVSVQKQGIDGGTYPGAVYKPLKSADPVRYASLQHPGDAYAYDIFSHAARAVRSSTPGGPLGPLKARRLIAIGVSQSAAFLVSYVNAVEPLSPVYDGFLIHSRFGTAAPFDGTSIAALDPKHPALAVCIRTDRSAPVMTMETETDVVGGYLVGYHAARQPDAKRLRVWEIAGGAHVDTYGTSVGAIDSGSAPAALLAERYRPSDKIGPLTFSHPINSAPQTHYVLQAALAGLDRWIRTGNAPRAHVAPIALQPFSGVGEPKLAVDDLGIARGGVRTPWVDVPMARLSGVGNSGSPAAFIFGVTEAFPQAVRDRLYADKAAYLDKFTAALTRTIALGFIMPSDRAEILAVARAIAW